MSGSNPKPDSIASTGPLLRDGAIAASLCVALALVYIVDRVTGANDNTGDDASTEVTVTEGGGKKVVPGKVRPLRIAVTNNEHSFDDVGKLLDTLGSGYKYTAIKLEDLLDSKRMEDFDIVFITCEAVPKVWTSQAVTGGANNQYVTARKWNADKQRDLKLSLRRYVEKGGTVYASDWAYAILEGAFREQADKKLFIPGGKQKLKADIVDEELKELFGPEIELNFDLGSWIPAAFSGREVTTLMSGTYATQKNGRATGPLLVRFPVEKGTVIFSSFHNERQNSKTEERLLKHLVFSTVVASADREIAQTMVKGGFSPRKRNLLSASSDAPSVTKTYNCKTRERLHFALAFENRGAKLELVVKSPSGKQYKKAGASTFAIEVPKPELGAWKYTVTAVKVPFENFPFTLTVFQK
jgi:hypothetical protein